MCIDEKSALADYPIPRTVAILGGGITGMMAAFWIKFLQPEVFVSIYEKSDRLGGWIQTKTMDYEGQKILMETGPRTFRNTPSNLNLIDMVRRLKLEKEIMCVPKTAPAATSRYMWLKSKLVRLPSGKATWEDIKNIFTLPILRHSLGRFITQPLRPARDPSVKDETIAEFISRRFSKRISHELASAVIHGIYAGDVNKLSAKSTLGKLWREEGMFGWIPFGKKYVRLKPFYTSSELLHRLELFNGPRSANYNLFFSMVPYTVAAFRNGSESLVRALEAELVKLGVRIVKNREVSSLTFNESTGTVTCRSEDGRTESFSNVISTIPGPQLNKLLPASLPEIKNIESVTCQVVNLYFKTPNLTPAGFGYLIPQSTPAEENPEHALGVIFDSHTRNDCEPLKEYGGEPIEKIPGTLVTVMMGGHYWKDRTEYPSSEEAILMARTTLARHLGITEEPVLTNATLQKDCIPQYTVGHEERMENLLPKLVDMFDGRLAVAGASYTSVSVPDLMLAGREVAIGVLGYRRRLYHNGYTGLETMLSEAQLEKIPMKKYYSLMDLNFNVSVLNAQKKMIGAYAYESDAIARNKQPQGGKRTRRRK
ncbi:Protoporphyrinogen oxidase [Ascobolus immersus RN42]|uniref:Protoporphyrinogen oxidase n=1 Tax=Ascobolus immersus RN42 TaxID=1160509 RepID=A0A3N4IBA7_ASCIM|nr:Protoporphyrinogen oxidase [Ascobolus immersus RN42]